MKAREINRPEEIEEVINKCQACHLSMVDEKGKPYVVPMNFGYSKGIVYLHSSRHGKRTAILQQHPDVCLAFSTDYHLRFQHEEVACSYGMKYKSILMFGRVVFIEETEEKTTALNAIMQQYTGKDFPYNMPAIKEVCVYKVIPEEVTGRAYGY